MAGEFHPVLIDATNQLVTSCRDVLARPGARGEVSLYSQFEAFFERVFVALDVFGSAPEVRLFQQMNAESMGIPDFRVERRNELQGWIEIKNVVGKDLNSLAGHDKSQVERFKNGLQNLLLTNGWQWRLYQRGRQLGRDVVLGPQDLFDPTHLLSAAPGHALVELQTLLTNFLAASPQAYATAPAAVGALASRAKALKLALLAVGRDGSGSTLAELESDFRALLYRNGLPFTWERFVDSYVQLATFGALLWRLETGDEISIEKQVGVSSQLHPLLAQCLALLWAPASRAPILEPLLEELCNTVNNITPALFDAPPAAAAGRAYVPDPIVHAYEPFFEVYDPATRETSGVYYTPVEIVEHIIAGVSHLLKRSLGREAGLLDDDARFLDPATGTGTFLLGLANAVAHEAAMQGLPTDQVVEEVLTTRTAGFELFPGPYTIAHQRLEVALRAVGGSPSTRLPIFLTDTLAAPSSGRLRASGFGVAGNQIQLERREVDRVKTSQRILVILGNPPYERVLESKGGAFEPFARGLFDQLRAATPADARADLKSTKDLFVAFWLWAIWALQSPTQRLATSDNPLIDPGDCHGIVGYISNRTWIVGRSLSGLRALVGKGAKEIWVCDLGGDGRGAHGARSFAGGDANVFKIRTGVAIAWVVFDRNFKGEPAIKYRRVYGTRAQKLQEMRGAFRDHDYEVVSVEGAGPFLPDRWSNAAMRSAPSLGDLFFDEPDTGIQTARDSNRYPPVGTTREEVFAVVADGPRRRTVGSLAEWSRLGRKQRYDEWVTAQKRRTREEPPDPRKLTEGAVTRFVFRPLDFRWVYDDPSWIDWYRPRLHAIYAGQARIPSLVTIQQDHGAGPAVIHVDCLMDQHSFNNRGAKGVFSLWHPVDQSESLDPRCPIEGNVRCGFSSLVYDWLEKLGVSLNVQAAYDYLLALLSAPSYTSTYWQALERDFLRVPLTREASVFMEGAHLGRRVRGAWSLAAPKPATLSWLGRAPEPLGGVKFVDNQLVFENGRALAGVPADMWSFEVSNYAVLRNWFRAREHWHLTASQAREALAVVSSVATLVDLGPDLDAVLDKATTSS